MSAGGRLAVLLAGVVVGFGAGCTRASDAAPGTASTTSTSTAPASSGPTSVTARGREVFLTLSIPSCASCHTLAEAGSVSAVGPDLDALRPSYQRVHAAVTAGIGLMPAQEGVLSPADIDAVSRYVAKVAGRAAR